ncbi:MAG: hypothetical protein HKN41_02585 [Ilumatobacter sp.]|nr:hypothetical protein [Ilumatobacter sp.]
MPNRSLLDGRECAVGLVHPGNLGRARSTTAVPDGAPAGGGYTTRRKVTYLDQRDEGQRADAHQHLHQRLLPHRMRA